MVLRDEPAVASAFVVWATSWACPRVGKPVVVELSRTQTHPEGGGFPGVPGPSGVVNVKLQSLGKPNCPGVRTWRSSSVCKRDLRVLAWVVARRSPRVMKVAFIILIYF